MLIAHAWVLELKVAFEFEWLHFYTEQLTQFIDLIKGIAWIQTSYLNIISATFSQRKIRSFVIHVISILIANCSPFHSRNSKKSISLIDITIFWGKMMKNHIKCHLMSIGTEPNMYDLSSVCVAKMSIQNTARLSFTSK